MNVVSRGVRNAFRNSIRTFSIVVILGLSIGLALAMLVARAAVQDKIQSVKSSIGNTLTVSPAGARGFEGGGEALTNEDLAKIEKLDHVTKVSKTLNDRLTTENSNLQSAIDAGSLGRRNSENNGVGFQVAPPDNVRMEGETGSDRPVTRVFTPPVMMIGLSDTSSPSAYGGSTVNFTSGQAFDVTKDENVAVVGKSLAEKNSLSVGSTFKAYNTDIQVVGIFDTGNDFANNSVAMPLSAVQRLSGQTASVTAATVTVDSIDNIDSVESAVDSTLGSKADVVNNKETAENAIEPLESVKSISTFSLIGAIGAGSIIILLAMVMIVRERRREIGVFKAIGASNLKIMFQFMTEAVTLTLLGMVAGLIIGAAAASPVTKTLVNNSTSSNNGPSNGPTLQVGGGPGRGGVFRSFGSNTVTNARSVQASVGWEILGYGFVTALAIAIVGSAVPTLLISKVRPAEVMRAE